MPLGSSWATCTYVREFKHSVYRGREAIADPPIDLTHNLNDELPDGRPVKRFYAVQDFFLSYFHPDWRVDGSSPDDVLRHFASHDRKGAQQVAAEIDEIIDLDDPEDTIRAFVLARYALHYDPSVDGLTMRQWLRQARIVLRGEGR